MQGIATCTKAMLEGGRSPDGRDQYEGSEAAAGGPIRSLPSYQKHTRSWIKIQLVLLICQAVLYVTWTISGFFAIRFCLYLNMLRQKGFQQSTVANPGDRGMK